MPGLTTMQETPPTTEIFLISGEINRWSNLLGSKPKKGTYDQATKSQLDLFPNAFTVALIDEQSKLATLSAAIPSPSTKRILIFTYDPDLDHSDQQKAFQKISQTPPPYIDRIMLMAPEHVKEAAIKLAEDVGGIQAQDVVCTPTELMIQMSIPTRKQLFTEYIQDHVIQNLEREKRRLMNKYALLPISGAHTASASEQKNTEKFQFNPLVSSKDAEIKLSKKSKETEKQRINAKQRCEELEKTIQELNTKLKEIKLSDVDRDAVLEYTLQSLKNIIESHIPDFDKRKKDTFGNQASKVGRGLANFLMACTLLIPPAMALIKYMTTRQTESQSTDEKKKDEADTRSTRLGKALGLSNTGLFFRLGGRTSYAGDQVLDNLDKGTKEIRKKEKNPNKNQF